MKRIFLTAYGFAVAAFAQDMISARAGMIQHVEGDVAIDGKALAMPSREKMFSQFPEVKKGSVLSTAEGRAEILLTPGVTLRLGENSSFKMIDSDLADAKVELQSGAAVVEVLEMLKDTRVTLAVGPASIDFRKAGTYKIHASDAPELMVYDGQADVTIAGQKKSAKKGNVLSLENALVARKFDTEPAPSPRSDAVRPAVYLPAPEGPAIKTADRKSVV